MIFSEDMQVGLAVFLLRLLKFEVHPVTKQLRVYGVQLLQTSTTLSMELFEEQQMVYAPLSASSGVEIQRFYMVEILSLSPVMMDTQGIADRRGGTLITVQGKGFRPGPGALCRLGANLANATVLSPNTLVCAAPRTVSAETCLTEKLEVTMNGVTFTQNQLAVERPEPVILQRVEPNRISVGQSVQFVLYGRGVIESNVAKCFFNDTTFGHANGITVTATYRGNPARYQCGQVKFTKPTSSDAFVTIALDGQIFSTFTLPFSVVGQPAGIVCVPPQLENQTSAEVRFNPPSEVYVVDSENNRLLAFDNVTTRPLTVYLDPKELLSGKNFSYMAPSTNLVQGQVSLGNLTMAKPGTGSHTFIVSSSGWTTTLIVRITFGKAARLIIGQQPYHPDDPNSYVVPESTLPLKTEVLVIDLADNLVPAADGTSINLTQARVTADNGTELVYYDKQAVPDPNDPTQIRLIETLNGGRKDDEKPIIVNGQGIATMERQVFQGTFGVTYVFVFSLVTDGNFNVSTIPIKPRCNPTHFWVAGQVKCQPCPTDQAICNGSDILIAREGYWRASPTSLIFYKCPQKNTCLGGFEGSAAAVSNDTEFALGGGSAASGFCREGFEGPLCSVCAPGYGRGFRKLCLPCQGIAVNVLQLVVLFLLFYVTMTFVVVVTVQNWRAMKNRVGDALILFQITVIYMQTASMLEFLDLDWANRVRNVFSFIGTAADFRLNTIEAANCLLRSAGFNQTTVSVMYTCFFLFIPIIALTAKLVLNLKPDILMSAEAKEVRKTRFEEAKAVAAGKVNRRLNWGGKAEKKGADHLKEHQRKTLLLVSTQVVLFFVFQSAVYNVFQTLPCETIDIGPEQNVTVLVADKSVDCTSSSYAGFEIYAYVTTALLGGAVPVGVFLFVGTMKNAYSDDYYHLYSSFVIQGMRNKMFFWQGLVYFRKVICVLIVILANYPLDCYFFLWFISCFAALQLRFLPYEFRRHNLLDGFGLLSIIVSANIALVYNITDGDDASPTGHSATHEALTITLLIIQILTLLVFVAEFFRLWFWKPLRLKKSMGRVDTEEEVEENTQQMIARIKEEERRELESKIVPTGPRSFAELMEERRKRNERELSYDNREFRGEGASAPMHSSRTGDDHRRNEVRTEYSANRATLAALAERDEDADYLERIRRGRESAPRGYGATVLEVPEEEEGEELRTYSPRNFHGSALQQNQETSAHPAAQDLVDDVGKCASATLTPNLKTLSKISTNISVLTMFRHSASRSSLASSVPCLPIATCHDELAQWSLKPETTPT